MKTTPSKTVDGRRHLHRPTIRKTNHYYTPSFERKTASKTPAVLDKNQDDPGLGGGEGSGERTRLIRTDYVPKLPCGNSWGAGAAYQNYLTSPRKSIVRRMPYLSKSGTRRTRRHAAAKPGDGQRRDRALQRKVIIDVSRVSRPRIAAGRERNVLGLRSVLPSVLGLGLWGQGATIRLDSDSVARLCPLLVFLSKWAPERF